MAKKHEHLAMSLSAAGLRARETLSRTSLVLQRLLSHSLRKSIPQTLFNRLVGQRVALVDGDLVTLEVTEQHEKQEEDPATRYYRSERSSSFQSRSVRLPPSARMDELQAEVEHGVLHVRVPKEKKKEEKAGPRRIKVGAGGGGAGAGGAAGEGAGAGVISAEEVKKAPSPAAAAAAAAGGEKKEASAEKKK